MRKWNADNMGTILTKDEDYIYIGLPHSFTARFVLMDAANDVGASLTAEYYHGSDSWRSVKNFSNETRIGAVPFAQSGFLSWSLPDDWVRNQVNSFPELPYDSNTGDGYGYFWIRIKSSETLKAETAVRWFGVIWTTQAYMQVRWQEVLSSDYLPSGQTDWYELIEMSTKDVANDLNVQNVIDYELQAKDISVMADLTALKAMINILLPLRANESLAEMKEDFQELYDKALAVRLSGIDNNQDEKLNPSEKRTVGTSRFTRA